MSQLVRTPFRLTADLRAHLAAAADRDAPSFVDRLDPALEPYLDVEVLGQPWFRRHHILDVQSTAPFPAERIHVAIGPSGLHVLTAHLEHLHAIVAADPPAGLDDEAEAFEYAAECAFWTRTSPVGELSIASFEDIPFYDQLDARERQEIDDLRQRFAAVIAPATRRRDARGWVFHSWLVAMSALIERELIVPPDGMLVRNDVMHATHMPLPYGNHWGMVGGRIVPIG